MKNKQLYFFVTILMLAAILVSCKKSEYLSSIVIDSIEAEDNITVIKYSVQSPEDIDVNYTGICYDTESNPDLLSNQVLANGYTREIRVADLEPTTELYFKAFVSNKYGYTESPSFAYTVPYLEVPSAPCSIQNGSIVKNGVSYNITSSSGSVNYNDEYELSLIVSNNMKVNLIFNTEMPINGVYTTVSSFDGYTQIQKMAKVTVQHSQFGGMAWTYEYSTETGASVYVENNNTDSLTVSFCDITHTYESVNYLMRGEFTKTY